MARKNFKMAYKVFSLLVALSLFLQQSGLAQIAAQLDFSSYLGIRQVFPVDKFRPLQMRYFYYNAPQDSFKLFLDKGDAKNINEPALKGEAKALFNYFLIGISLPNEAFWVNLRPDSENQIINDQLARTDIGRVMLEADLQLKKDTARLTSPDNPKGRQYWEKLYKKAGELFGTESVNIPTLTRPWIVPGEVIVRYTDDSAYVYKSTLKVMLEQDYLKDSATYNFTDPRLKALNEYSSGLIRELIIPQLNKEINTSRRYAALRQVFYSLILAQCFKLKFDHRSPYARRIDSGDLTGLTSKTAWSKTTYFKEYQKSFKDGEYNIKESVYTASGQVIRAYFSGGINPVLANTSGAFMQTAGSGAPVSGAARRAGFVGIEFSGQGEYTQIAGSSKEASSPVNIAAVNGEKLPAGERLNAIVQHQYSTLSYDPAAKAEQLLPEAIRWAKEHGFTELTVNPNNLSTYISYLVEHIDSPDNATFKQAVQSMLAQGLRGVEFEHALISYVIKSFLPFFNRVSYEVDADIELARFQKDWGEKSPEERTRLEEEMVKKTIAEIKRISAIDPQKMMVKVPNTSVGHEAVRRIKLENPNVHINFTLFFSFEDAKKGVELLGKDDVLSIFVSRIDALTQVTGKEKYKNYLNYAQGLIGLIIAKKFYDYCKEHNKDARIIMASLGAKTKIPAWMYVYHLIGGNQILTMPRDQAEGLDIDPNVLPIRANLELPIVDFLLPFVRYQDCIAAAKENGFWGEFTEGEMTEVRARELVGKALAEWESLDGEINRDIFATLARNAFDTFYKPFSVARTQIQKLEDSLLAGMSASSTAGSGYLEFEADAGGREAASSPTKTGGIDFRYIGLMTQFQKSDLKANFNMPDINALKKIDLISEREQINKMMEARILPSAKRLTDYICACYLRQGSDEGMAEAVVCLTNLFKLEEEEVAETDQQLKSFLSFMESSNLS